jgi:hypothetical protein
LEGGDAPDRFADEEWRESAMAKNDKPTYKNKEIETNEES